MLRSLETAAGIEEPAVTPEPLTKEKVFAAFPELKAMESAFTKQQDERRATLITVLEASKQDAYAPDELKSMPLEQLEKVVKLTASAKPASSNVVSFAGQGTPRAASADEAVPAPPDLGAEIRAARAK